MSTFEEARTHYEPLADMDRRSHRWPRAAVCGRSQPRLDRGSVDRRIPVKPRCALDLIDWIWTHPDEINRAMETELADSLGNTVEILEWYPPTPAEREEIGR